MDNAEGTSPEDVKNEAGKNEADNKEKSSEIDKTIQAKEKEDPKHEESEVEPALNGVESKETEKSLPARESIAPDQIEEPATSDLEKKSEESGTTEIVPEVDSEDADKELTATLESTESLPIEAESKAVEESQTKGVSDESEPLAENVADLVTEETTVDKGNLVTEESIKEVDNVAATADAEPLSTEMPESIDDSGTAEDITDVEPEKVKEQTEEVPIASEPSLPIEAESNKVDEAQIKGDSDESEPATEKVAEVEIVDYATLSKEQLVDIVKDLGKSEKPVQAEKTLKIIAPFFNAIRSSEREEAKKKFLEEGGNADDFEYRNDELSNRFDANYKLVRDNKNKVLKSLDQEREKNYEKAKDVLERLRVLVDSDESSSSFTSFKELQQEWKSIGDVPGAHSRTLWANYHAITNLFYDHRSIYFELKELDRRKNLEKKIVLCEQAEELSKKDDIRTIIGELNELHKEFKHIGPVPKDDQEPLWQRFKAASDIIYAKRKDFVHHLKADFEENLKKKVDIISELEPFLSFDSDRIKEWNSKTKEVLAIQKKWEAIGGVPKENAKSINKQFWGSFKKFFHNKSDFFKKLEALRGENLNAKMELVQQAEELKESSDWEKVASQLKDLQKKWRDIGPVPEKSRNEVYESFKKACDDFFNRRRENLNVVESEYEGNLEKKDAIIKKMDEDTSATSNGLMELIKEYDAVGFVPKQSINALRKKMDKAIDSYITRVEGLNGEEKELLKLKTSMSKLVKGDGSDKQLVQKEQAVRRQIQHLENDIALLRNNLEFFARSKNADKLREDVNAKIDASTNKLLHLKGQLKIIRSM